MPPPIRQTAGTAVSGGEAGGRSVAGRADRLGRPRHQGPGASAGRAGAGRRARRRARRVASDLRRRLAADGAAGRQLRPDGRAEGILRARHFRRDSAPGRHEGLEHHRGDQQGRRRADLRSRRLRHRRRPVRDRAGDGDGAEGVAFSRDRHRPRRRTPDGVFRG